jgi:hypothetical protein
VAEVVEGPELPPDPRRVERGAQVGAREAGRVDGCAALGVGEDEVVVGLVGALLPVLGEELHGAWAEVDGAA